VAKCLGIASGAHPNAFSTNHSVHAIVMAWIASNHRQPTNATTATSRTNSNHTRRWLGGVGFCGAGAGAGAGSSLISNSRRAASVRINGLMVPSGRFPSRAHYPGP
jgi:hypothetical protein